MAELRYFRKGDGKLFLVDDPNNHRVLLVNQSVPYDWGWPVAAFNYTNDETHGRRIESMSFGIGGSGKVHPKELENRKSAEEDPTYYNQFARLVARLIVWGECHLILATYERIYGVFDDAVAETIVQKFREVNQAKKELQAENRAREMGFVKLPT